MTIASGDASTVQDDAKLRIQHDLVQWHIIWLHDISLSYCNTSTSLIYDMDEAGNLYKHTFVPLWIAIVYKPLNWFA